MYSYDKHHPLEDPVFITKTQYNVCQYSIAATLVIGAVYLVKLLL